MAAISKPGCVYILTNKVHTVLYTGVTSNLRSRIWQHREHWFPGSFSARYNCTKLVYYRFFDGIVAAIAEEKRIKGGSRADKLALINNFNSEWNDLWEAIQDF